MSTYPKVLYVGDSFKMKGGVSAVIKMIASTFIWDRYHCHWLECQINDARWKKWAYLLRALFKGIVLIPRHQIIHFHTAVENSLRVQLPFLLYALAWRKKIIVQFHVGNQLQEASGDPLFRFFCKHADQVLTLSDSLRSCIPGYDEHPEKVGFLYNPAPEPTEKTVAEHYFLMAAYLTPDHNKGCDTVLEAFSSFHRRYPGWKLVICGSGDMAGLNALIGKFGLQDAVQTPGWVTGPEKDLYFRNAYAYCMASRKEGLPVSILESMSAGLPIITTPVGSIPEILSDEESALFFNPGDADGLCGQMCRLAEDPDMGKRLAIHAQAVVQDKLSLRQFAEKLDALYLSLNPLAL